ncbi:MAG: lipoate protein ligase C-terminal domain-containing protein [Candidatus Woesearchaeota archaeon]
MRKLKNTNMKREHIKCGEKRDLQVDYKVPGGKLLRIRAKVTNTIQFVEIAGDFFIYPEESISDIENCLIGCNIVQHEIETRLSAIANKKNIIMVGISPKHIADAIIQGHNSSKELNGIKGIMEGGIGK